MGKYLDLADQAIRRLDAEREEVDAVPPVIGAAARAVDMLLPGPYIADPRRCAGCGRGGFVLMLVTHCGDNLCWACWKTTTKAPDVHQPPTPDLDRLMRLADQRAERERA